MKSLSTLFIILLFCTGCELAVNVNVPRETQRLTANAVFLPDSLWYTDVYLSRYILDNSPFQRVYNAQIIISSANDEPIDTLKPAGQGYLGHTKPVYNKVYKIKITAPGFESVSATSSIPEPAIIKDVNYNLQQESKKTRVSFTIEDRDQEDNYYSVALKSRVYFSDGVHDQYRDNSISITSNDPSVQTDYSTDNHLLFSDITFKGKDYKVTIETDSYFGENTSLSLVIQTLSKDYYEYLSTSSLQSNTKDDPFSQPVNVYNNIQNGFGIFAGYSEERYPYTF